jgi:hypothetical protein
MASEKMFIVAGTRQEYEHFIRKKADELAKTGYPISLSHFAFVSSPDVLRGHREVHGWFCGTYRQLRDIKEIVFRIRLANNIPDGVSIIPELNEL